MRGGFSPVIDAAAPEPPLSSPHTNCHSEPLCRGEFGVEEFDQNSEQMSYGRGLGRDVREKHRVREWPSYV